MIFIIIGFDNECLFWFNEFYHYLKSILSLGEKMTSVYNDFYLNQINIKPL